ncbi:MAG: hypothetical protein NTZ05_08500 [Chloroflexi bacterium]|nr:hypothetical protein [Chloroflexota bacterium]
MNESFPIPLAAPPTTRRAAACGPASNPLAVDLFGRTAPLGNPTVTAGQTVQWRNRDAAAHAVTATVTAPPAGAAPSTPDP